jgi:hypothetical protein
MASVRVRFSPGFQEEQEEDFPRNILHLADFLNYMAISTAVLPNF